MTKYKRIAILFMFSTTILICCKSTTPATKSTASAPATNYAAPSLAPDGNDVVVAQGHWPGTTLDNLADGYKLYTDKCVDCHEAKLPQDFSVDDWNAILPKMGRKAHLDSIQYKSVYHYIIAKRETILSAKK